MKLGEKIRYLREVEGALRGLDRAMTQQEVVRAILKDLKKPISQSYLSQIENNQKEPNISTLKLISNQLQVAVPILFFLALDEADRLLDPMPRHDLPASGGTQ